MTQAAADRTLDVLLQHGVNHIDVAASYGDAELRIAPWLKREPKRFFLATKTGERTAKRAREELHRSLDRLGVDHVDLWQLHNLADPIEWDTALSPGGVIEAAVEARDQGLIKWIGVTGHGAQIEALTRTCAERNVAVQTIKSIAAKPWLGREHTHTTWYEPLEGQADIDLAVWWVLGRRGVFLNTAGDIDLLPRVLDAAERFETRPTDAQMTALRDRTRTEPLFV